MDERVAAHVVDRVLLVAFQYPPMSGTSGVQRALRFSQYLGEFGWEPLVLTAHPRAYPSVSDDQLGDIPRGIVVRRAFALDAARHFSFFRRYPSVLARPDRWMAWRLGAVPAGLALIKRYRPRVIWSTFPIATAHSIALALHERTGLPWVADFRDLMVQGDYPTDPKLRESWGRLEARCLRACTRAVFTTPGAARIYAARYPQCPPDSFVVIENGYDEQAFAAIEHCLPQAAREEGQTITLLHSGVIYPSERDPTQLFAAIQALLREGMPHVARLRLVLRGTGHDAHIGRLISRFGLQGIVELAPAIPYRESLAEMLSADGLLLLQANNCNEQIPAKMYEYLRSGRPILGLADGDTAAALRNAGIGTVARLESAEEIQRVLAEFLRLVVSGRAPVASREAVMKHSRRSKTADLVRILRSLADSRPRLEGGTIGA